MVTIIKIKNIKDTSWVPDMERMFEDNHKIYFSDCILVSDSDCGKYEYLYLFMNDFEIRTFLNLLLEFKVEVLSRTDFTKEMIDVLMNNDIDKFKENFNGMVYLEDVIENFGIKNIDKDMVLDKISKHGIKSLNNFDYKILES